MFSKKFNLILGFISKEIADAGKESMEQPSDSEILRNIMKRFLYG